VERRAVMRGPFAATRFFVLPDGESPPAEVAPDGHDHSHDHSHGHSHSHSHSHSHALDHGPSRADDNVGPAADPGDPEPGPAAVDFAGQPPRTWAQIREMILAARFVPRVEGRALAAFGRLAEVEAHAHGLPVEEVGFHEVGAVDSIIDMVGAAILLEQLGVERIVASALPLGSGQIWSAHGRIPVPAPATLALLRGWPVTAGLPGAEMTTPTGAALISTLAEPGPLPDMIPLADGYGAGGRNPPARPNVLRAVLGRPAEAQSPRRVEVLEAQVDDMSGELLPPLLEALLGAGALDALAWPVLMKKGRSGMMIQALCAPEQAAAVGEALLRHSSSLGYRRRSAEREVLERRHVAVRTPWGPVQVKVGERGGQIYQVAPEFEDVRRVALEAGQPAMRVHQQAVAAALELLGLRGV
jgi:pyridinium-3,5-bisthiocarboxylic acid mononucleotide nickel chelatase